MRIGIFSKEENILMITCNEFNKKNYNELMF